MQFPESWLREFCNPPLSSQELADKLTMAGLEVEEMVSVAPPFSSIVVGAIVEAEQHPNADRLRVCKVDVGQGEPLQIVCGAPNARRTAARRGRQAVQDRQGQAARRRELRHAVLGA
jgi:phenylalanyl-tRNA synthetase beta chain